jgi:SWI/SNF-related matrix-associated actin-dependent regulator 1 of chromatin subfamily A
MIRRKKDDVLSDLPPKQRQVVYIEISDVARETLSTMLTGYKTHSRAIHTSGPEQRGFHFGEKYRMLMDFYMFTGRAKIEPTLQYLMDLMKTTEKKILIFGHHVDVLKALAHKMMELDVDFIKIDGSTPPTKRAELVDYFQSSETCRLAILAITAAGVGLNLTAASMVVFVELFWNPAALVQAEDRAHRIGQKDSVDIRYVLAKNTMDELMW